LAQIALDSAQNFYLTSNANRMLEQSKFAAIWTLYGRSILVLCVFALFLHDIFGTHGYLAMRRTKLDIERVQSDINRLAKENAELSDEVKSLKTDPHKIESIARDELGLAKPNEVIIKIPQSQQAKP
jgi:cell division protein FtsB